MKTETSLQVYQGMYVKAGCKFNQLWPAGQFNYLTLHRIGLYCQLGVLSHEIYSMIAATCKA